jgi:DNA modification methylase
MHTNTIIHGYCLHVLPGIPSASVDFILTDPPYLVNYKPRDGRAVGGDKSAAWLKPAFAQMHRALKADGYCCSFYGWPNADRFMEAFRAAGFRPLWGISAFRRPTPLRWVMSGVSTNAAICWRRAIRTGRSSRWQTSSNGKTTPATSCTRRKSPFPCCCPS